MRYTYKIDRRRDRGEGVVTKKHSLRKYHDMSSSVCAVQQLSALFNNSDLSFVVLIIFSFYGLLNLEKKFFIDILI